MAYRGSKGKAEVLEILRDQMLFLELKPGESIQDSELARKLDVSRTPVREALLALQKEGLVDIYPQSGTFVSRIDMELLSEIAYIRRMVEGDVFRTLVGQKANLRGRLEKFILLQELAARENNLKDYVVNDHLFHQALFRAAGHARAWTVIEPHFRLITRFHMLYFQSSGGFGEKSMQEHREIISCMEAGDDEAANRLLSSHYHCVSTDSEVIREFRDYFVQ
jgi:DNA-binding GntR family transcriptional regulator